MKSDVFLSVLQSVTHTRLFLLSNVCSPRPEALGGHSRSLLSLRRPAQGLALDRGSVTRAEVDSFRKPWAEPGLGCGITLPRPLPMG